MPKREDLLFAQKLLEKGLATQTWIDEAMSKLKVAQKKGEDVTFADIMSKYYQLPSRVAQRILKDVQNMLPDMPSEAEVNAQAAQQGGSAKENAGGPSPGQAEQEAASGGNSQSLKQGQAQKVIPSTQDQSVAGNPITPQGVVIEPAPEPQGVVIEPAPEPQGVVIEPAPEPQGVVIEPEPEPQGVVIEPEPEPQGVVIEPEPEPQGVVIEPEPEPQAALFQAPTSEPDEGRNQGDPGNKAHEDSCVLLDLSSEGAEDYLLDLSEEMGVDACLPTNAQASPDKTAQTTPGQKQQSLSAKASDQTNEQFALAHEIEQLVQTPVINPKLPKVPTAYRQSQKRPKAPQEERSSAANTQASCSPAPLQSVPEILEHPDELAGEQYEQVELEVLDPPATSKGVSPPASKATKPDASSC